MSEVLQLSDFDLNAVSPGTKWKGWISIGELPAGEQVRWPVLVVRGQRPGKVLLANAGTHGDEYEGIAAIHRVFHELDPQEMAGTFLAIPILSPPAFTGGQRNGLWDDRNLARSFPGDPEGLLTERIAHGFATSILPLADLYLDLHAGGTGVNVKTFIGCVTGDCPVAEIQRKAAIAFGLDIVWNTGVLPGRTLSAAWEAQVPAMYTESPGNRTCLPEEVDKMVAGLFNLLRFLGNLQGEFPTEPPPFFHEEVSGAAGHMQEYHRAQYGGLFIPTVKLWDRIEKGQLLGTVFDPLGDPLEEIVSSQTGRLLTLRICPRVMPGEFTAVIVPFSEL